LIEDDINRKLEEYGNHVHPDAKSKLLAEIEKMEQAQSYANDFKNGSSPRYPRWATSGDNYQAIQNQLNQSED
ncbi:MAG: hypothetical protein MUE53_09830, partial [Chitinophagales bacterium]|nr:hypothetical protein [Chitinophagales bacterium]